MNPLISVIVAVYNTERFLERTLYCISNQSYRNLEILLIDDGSTDSSGEICDAFAKKDSRCKVIHKQNGGQGSAKNTGLAAATGNFLFFPDSDDNFSLDMIRLLYEAIKKNPCYDIALSGSEIIVEDQVVLPTLSPMEDFDISEFSRDALIHGLFQRPDDRFVYGWNKLYRKALLENTWWGDYPRHQDFDFNFRVFLKTRKAVFVNLELYHWVQWNGSKTHQSNSRDLYFKSRTALLYDNWVHLVPKHKQYEYYLLDALYHTMVFWEEWSRKSGNFSEAKALCRAYTKGSLRRYLLCDNIGLGKKTICLILLSFPCFAHFVMRVTKNAR